MLYLSHYVEVKKNQNCCFIPVKQDFKFVIQFAQLFQFQ
jgi:hypothetical protein